MLDRGAQLGTGPGNVAVSGVCETRGVLKMPPLIFHKWKKQGLVSSPPSVPAVFVYSAYFFPHNTSQDTFPSAHAVMSLSSG